MNIEQYKSKGDNGLKEYKRLLYPGVPLYNSEGAIGNGIGFYPREYRLDYYKNRAIEYRAGYWKLKEFPKYMRDDVEARNKRYEEFATPRIQECEDKIVLFTNLLI